MNYKWILIGLGILLILLIVYKKKDTILKWFGKKPEEQQNLLKPQNDYKREKVKNEYKNDSNNELAVPTEEYVVLEIASSPEEDKEIILGEIFIKLHDNVCPRTCENFRSLAKIEYKGCVFHRLIPGFMIQGGDYENSNGTGGASTFGPKFPDENFILKHNKRGVLAMANSGPDTNGSQFYIIFNQTPHLDGKHVVFGEIVKGLEILDIIENMPTNQNDKPEQLLYIRNTRVTNRLN